MTIKTGNFTIFATKREIKKVEGIHIFAFTHRHLEVDQIGHLHIAPDDQKDKLNAFKEKFGFDELMYISTCNRVEFIISKQEEISVEDFQTYLRFLYPNFDEDQIRLFANQVEKYINYEGIEHLIKVTSSIDSMVVGEREIITQVRKAFDACKGYALTG